VELTDQDFDQQLDTEYASYILEETNQFNKEYDLNNKCINICADIRDILDKSGLDDKIFINLDVDTIKQFLYETYS
jgi:hypothetical protein